MAGPRIFDAREAERFIPRLEEIFGEVDQLRSRMRALKLRVDALEMIWGERLHQPDNPDHAELQHHLKDMRALQTEFERAGARVTELGGELKGLDPPLVDFYGVHDGRLVFWCWTRGEKHITHWHHVDEGFAGRRAIERA